MMIRPQSYASIIHAYSRYFWMVPRHGRWQWVSDLIKKNGRAG